MATYLRESMTRPLDVEPEPLCDPHSTFDSDGFPLPVDDGMRRSWTPLWGGMCVRCGVRC